MYKRLTLPARSLLVAAMVGALSCNAPAPKQPAPVAQPVSMQLENVTLPEMADFLDDNYCAIEIDGSVGSPEKIIVPTAQYQETPLATVLDALLPPLGLTWRYDETRKCVVISAVDTE
ncbi:MAG: hypothetical protein HYV27_23385 [Candidatus Hydrogenedentes bacterium]|nr:hypothetical protein [Candidatus Hydrogenedentota bacterium]